jgi:hypothetical protein
MIYQQFYSELGKLLYALADVDGSISQTERSAMHELVKKELVPIEKNTDEFGTDAAFYAEIEFEILEDTAVDPEVAFESFINFIDDHKTAIDNRMIDATRRVAVKLSESYYHASHKEKELLERLNNKLDEIQKNKKHDTLHRKK